MKNREGLFITYSGACKSGAYFDEYQLPKLNGVSIEAIYSPCEFSTDERMVDAKGWKFVAPNIHTKTQAVNQFGFLPDEFKKLFGKQIINGKEVFVRNIWFRTDSSGHASEDDVMSIGVENNSYSVWHREKDKKFDYQYAITQHDPYVQKWLKLFNTELTVNHPKRYFWEFEKLYPKLDARRTGTRIQYVKGYIFPDMVSKHWKPFASQPIKIINDNQIILFHEEDMELIYLSRATDLAVGDWGLVHFERNRENPHYGNLRQYTKQHGGGICKYRVEKINRKKEIFFSLDSGKPLVMDKDYFWRINMVMKVQPEDIKTIKAYKRV